MKKIKKFKINIRLRETMRLLKSTAHIPELTSEIEDEIHRQSRRMNGIISTAALYETLPKEKFPPELVVESPPELGRGQRISHKLSEKERKTIFWALRIRVNSS